jgi:hypothetical protein
LVLLGQHRFGRQCQTGQQALQRALQHRVAQAFMEAHQDQQALMQLPQAQ